ncbi:DEAD/DEAH box helicase [Patescibacteria group bacterium]
MTTFSEFEISEPLKQVLQEMNFTQPTPVQEKVIPQILESHEDIIALAQTGTGKTAAFSLPVLTKMDPNFRQVQAVVLSPTRELAMQIAEDMRGFAKHMKGIKIAAVYGGASIHDQIRDLKRGAQIVVGTPGRMLDLLKRNVLKLGGVQWAILDEADEMLNMGFLEDITSILSNTPKDKQTLLFSATMSRTIENIAKKYMQGSKRFELQDSATNQLDISHQFMMVPAKDKVAAFQRYKKLNPGMYGIIFCRTRRECQEIGDTLLKDGVSTGVLHGEIEQKHRTRIMDAFKRKETTLLVATDVAARGIDVEKLTHVIHMGVPEKVESYTHRSGRTGRANESGISIVFANLREHRALYKIEKMKSIKFEEIKLPKREDMIEAEIQAYVDRVDTDYKGSAQANEYVNEMLEGLSKDDLAEVARKALIIAVDDSIKKYPHEQMDKPQPRERHPRGGHSRGGSGAKMATLVIGLGRKDSLTVPNLLGMVNNVSKGERIDIGQIQLGDKESSFEVPVDVVKKLSKSMSSSRFRGQRVRVREGAPVERTRGGSRGAPRGRSQSRGYQGKKKARKY